MSHHRLPAGRASTARRDASHSKKREAARRRSRPRLESLEGRVVLSWPGATLDVSSAPYFMQASLPAPVVRSLDWTYGQAIAATPDGNVVAISAVVAPDAPADWHTMGVVEVWARAGGDWARAATLTPPPEELNSRIGWDLVISDDGSTIVASAVANRAEPDDYSLLVYERDGAGWTFRQDIDVAGGRVLENLNDPYNSRLTISGDGDLIALGIPGEIYSPTVSVDGVVRVFTRSDSGPTWEESAELTPPNPGSATNFGISIDISADGSTLAVASAGFYTPSTGAGNLFVYQAEAGGAWGAPTSIEASPRIVSLSGDGRTLLASAIEPIPGGGPQDLQGAAYLYEDTGSGWVRTARFAEPQPSFGLEYGRRLGLSPDGDTAVVADVDRFTRDRLLYVYDRDAGWGRAAVIKPVGSMNDGGGFFGGLAVSDRDVIVRSPRSSGFTVDVYHRPDGLEVILDPTDLASTPGEPTTFLAAAAGAAGLSVQWQSSADDGQTWTDLVGAIYDWYTFSPTLADSGRMFRAVYTSGDGVSATTRPATLSVAKAIPVITVDYSPEGLGVNKMVRFQVRVASAGDNPNVPTGNVTLRFTDTSGRVYTSRGMLDRGQVVLMESEGAPPGVYQVLATYDPIGDQVYPDRFFAATSTTFTMVIPKAVPALHAELADPTPQNGEQNQLIIRSETYYVGFGPTGLVSVWNGSEYLGAAPFEWEPGGTYKQAVIPFRFTAGGLQTLTWSYVGDDAFQALTRTLDVDVARAATTIVATPTSGSLLSYYGESTTWEVTARTTTGAPAVGWVSVSLSGMPGLTVRGQTDADGRVLIVIPGGAGAGGHVATFNFDQSDNFTHSVYTSGVGVYKAPTALSLTMTTSAVAPGDPATFVARVRNAVETIQPTSGVVQFYVDGVLAATVPVGLNGEATYTTSALSAGVHDVVAVFPETANFQGVVSNRVAQLVGRSETVTNLWSTRNPSTAGESLEYVVLVAPASWDLAPVTGVVRFYLGLEPIAEVPVDANGHAILPARFDAAGAYQITAVYLGNAEYDTSMSIHLVQTVRPTAVAASVVLASPAPTKAASASAVALEESRPSLTPAQARRAAFAARLVQRQVPIAARPRR